MQWIRKKTVAERKKRIIWGSNIILGARQHEQDASFNFLLQYLAYLQYPSLSVQLQRLSHRKGEPEQVTNVLKVLVKDRNNSSQMMSAINKGAKFSALKHPLTAAHHRRSRHYFNVPTGGSSVPHIFFFNSAGSL